MGGIETIKQPNGRYALWSNVTDRFAILNLRRDDVFFYYDDDEQREAILFDLDAGRKPHPLAKSWEDALDLLQANHGNPARQEVQAAVDSVPADPTGKSKKRKRKKRCASRTRFELT